jgi:hypothetical protein
MKFRLRVCAITIKAEKLLAQNIMNQVRISHINESISNERCFNDLSAQAEAVDYLIKLEGWLA